MDAMTEPVDEKSNWSLPIREGLMFGHPEEPDALDDVIIDNFQFVPAELNHLAFLGQIIG